jgi:DNA-binding MarR family transcriptional regulator
VATSRDLPEDRLAVGQLLGRLLRRFRSELLAPGAEAGFDDLREAHLQIFGNLGIEGIRLTELAARAQLSNAAASELVDDLQASGYLERRPDPSDGRAKLIFPTERGRRALDAAGDRVADIEHRWADLVGPSVFEAAMQTLHRLVQDGTAQAGAPEPDPTTASDARMREGRRLG